MTLKFHHLLGVLVVLVIVAGVLFKSAIPERLATRSEPGSLVVTIDPVREDTARFIWRGAIDPPMAQRFSHEFAAWKDKTTRIVIDLHSPGGRLDEGERVIEVIKNMKKTHAVQTFVGAGNDCLSMCVPLYLQGRVRIASSFSRWMFHKPRAVNIYTGADEYRYSGAQSQSAQDFYVRFFKRSPMRAEWRNGLREQWRYGDVWKSGRELKNERSNIVTILAD